MRPQLSPAAGREALLYILNRSIFFPPQTEIALSMLDRYTAARSSAAPVILFERSLAVSREVFLPLNGHLSAAAEYHQLKSLCLWGENHFERGIPTLYLHSSTSAMTERVVTRNREAERRMRYVGSSSSNGGGSGCTSSSKHYLYFQPPEPNQRPTGHEHLGRGTRALATRNYIPLPRGGSSRCRGLAVSTAGALNVYSESLQ